MSSVGGRAALKRGKGLTHDVAVALQTPLPVYLLTTVAGLREKSAKGYPVKKVGPRRRSLSRAAS